jgi:tetratricopeptide (TPR) repeat protein
VARGAPPLAAILDAFAQAGEGLGAAHARGIVHRDFKPENVLVGADGRVRVADFGLSRLGAPRPAASPVRLTGPRGTPEYMAPELWRGEPATAASDVFAFCTALAEAIAGQRTADPAHITGALRERGIAPGLHAATMLGLDDDPHRRPAIEHIVAELRAGPVRTRRRWIAAASAGVLAAGALAGALAVRADDAAPPCVDDAAVLAGRWDAAQRAAMASFLSPESSQATAEGAQRVLAILDDHVSEIVALGTATCRATQRGELTAVQAAMRSSCLERRAIELGGIVARILGDKWDLATAQERAQSPSNVESCRDMAAPAIQDRAAVAALYARYADIRTGALAARGAAYAQLERDASALGETELALRVAISEAARLREADQIERADEALQRAYRQAVEIRGEGHAAIALVERANLASRNGDPAGARSLSKLALEVADRPGVSVRTRARIYLALGRAEYERGDAPAAVDKLRTALDLLTNHNLKTGANELQIRNFLIIALSDIEGRNREAVKLARETVELARQMEGERSINYATLISLLAMTLRIDGDLDGALQHRKRALEILEPLVPPGHSRIVVHQTDYAYDLLAAGQFEQARGNFEAGLAQCDRNQALRAFRPMFRGGLAGALWELGRHTEGVQLLEQTIVELTSQLGKDHPRTVHQVRRLAELELELGRLDASARHIAAVEHGYLARPQPRDARAIRLRGTLAAQLAIARGDPRAAEAIARKALAELAELSAEGERDVLVSLAGSLVARRRLRGRLPVQRRPAVDRRQRRQPQLGARHEARHQPGHRRLVERRLRGRLPVQHRPAVDRRQCAQPQLGARHARRH